MQTPRPRMAARLARLWVATLAACGWFAAPAPSAGESPPPSAETHEAPAQPAAGLEAEAVLVGSSSFNQAFGRIIERELTRWGYRVARKAVSGAGLARPDFHDMHQELETLPIGKGTAAVFVYLGVNDAQAVWLHPFERGAAGQTYVPFGAPDWDAIYTRRTREFLERICQRGARRAVVLLPVDVNLPDMQRRLDRVRDIQARAASETSCASVVSTAGDAGRFDEGGVAKRLPDGFHMSSLGAQIVWERIQPHVVRLLEPDPPG